MLLSFPHNITLVAAAGWAANANSRTEKYCWKMWQILAKIQAVPNVQIGGARQAAVASQPVHVWKFCQLKNCSLYTDDSLKYTSSRVLAIMKALEACKVKLWCFKGSVTPTDIHGSWGTWLLWPLLSLKLEWFLSIAPQKMIFGHFYFLGDNGLSVCNITCPEHLGVG